MRSILIPKIVARFRGQIRKVVLQNHFLTAVARLLHNLGYFGSEFVEKVTNHRFWIDKSEDAA
jgi:hypothetical protein